MNVRFSDLNNPGANQVKLLFWLKLPMSPDLLSPADLCASVCMPLSLNIPGFVIYGSISNKSCEIQIALSQKVLIFVLCNRLAQYKETEFTTLVNDIKWPL